MDLKQVALTVTTQLAVASSAETGRGVGMRTQAYANNSEVQFTIYLTVVNRRFSVFFKILIHVNCKHIKPLD